MVLLLASSSRLSAQTTSSARFQFDKVADSTEEFTSFATFPSINSHGTVVFEAMGSAFGDGVFKWHDGELTPIATTKAQGLTLFGIDPVINDAGVVAYEANIDNLTRGIFTTDGTRTRTVVNTTAEGLIFRFLGSPSLNEAGDVAFSGVRDGLASQAIFVGNGGPLTIVADTLASSFTGFQNAAINDFGKVVFVADSTDGSTGLFVVDTKRNEDGKTTNANAVGKPVDIIDTNNPDFVGFGDPVINRFGTVADDAFRSNNTLEILSGNRHRVTARTDIDNSPFAEFEDPSINSFDAVAFSVVNNDSTQAIFLNASRGAELIPVIQSGDTLFGSTVTSLELGRFALNDRFQLVFQYTLQNGRTGVAIATLR